MLFGLGAGFFAAAVLSITYYLWMSAFELNSQGLIINSRIDTELFIAGLQHYAIIALFPMMAGALFMMMFYQKGNLVQLLSENAMATILMVFIIFIATPYWTSTPPLEAFFSALTSFADKIHFTEMTRAMLVPLLIEMIVFLIWTTAGAFLTYLMISKTLVERKKNSARNSSIVTLALISLVAIAPPAITYAITAI